MKRQIRRRYWIEVAAAGLSVLLLVMTLAWPTWIELLFGFDPDGGNGEAEWWIAATFVAISLGCSVLARRERRRAVLAGA